MFKNIKEEDIDKILKGLTQKQVVTELISEDHDGSPSLPGAKRVGKVESPWEWEDRQARIRNKYFYPHDNEKTCVLGLDIYHYSKYVGLKQDLIPALFEDLYRTTVGNLLVNEGFFFARAISGVENTLSEFKKCFISTGDGGYQILPSPVHAVVFMVYFESVLKSYNTSLSGKSQPKLLDRFARIHDYVGTIHVRYAATFGDLFQYNNNYFGQAIITCARILSRDRLNRFLVDDGFYTWCQKHIWGIDNLSSITSSDLEEISGTYKSENCTIFSQQRIKNVISQKIGKVKPKGYEIDIYNVYFQILVNFIVTRSENIDAVVNVGNLNSDHLDDD